MGERVLFVENGEIQLPAEVLERKYIDDTTSMVDVSSGKWTLKDFFTFLDKEVKTNKPNYIGFSVEHDYFYNEDTPYVAMHFIQRHYESDKEYDARIQKEKNKRLGYIKAQEKRRANELAKKKKMEEKEEKALYLKLKAKYEK
jgi:hypothetical protein